MFQLVTAKKLRIFYYGHLEQIETMLENSQLLFLFYFLHLLLCQDSEMLGQLGGIPHLSKQQNHTQQNVGCVNKGKHACTNYLVPSSLGNKE